MADRRGNWFRGGIGIPSRAVAGRVAQAGLAGSPGEPPGGDGRSASRGALRPDVGRRAHADRATAAERAGVCPKECGGIYRGGKSKRGLSVCGCPHATNQLSILKRFNFISSKNGKGNQSLPAYALSGEPQIPRN